MKKAEYKNVFEFLVEKQEKLKKNCKIQILQEEGKVIFSKKIISRIFFSIFFGSFFLAGFIGSIFTCFLGIKESQVELVLGGVFILVCNISFAWALSLVNKIVTMDFNTETFMYKKFFFWLCEYKFSDLKGITCINKYFYVIYLGTEFKLSFEANESSSNLVLPNNFRKENIETIKTLLNFIYQNT